VAARHQVVLLPGGVLPAEPAYAALLQVLGQRVNAVTKDLEVYSDDQPPPDFSLDTEADGILREADGHGFDRFHLVGYSGGGASSLAFAAVHGERLLSLALLEPAWAGNERTPAEQTVWQRFHALDPLPPDQFMAGFMRLQLAPGVEPPPAPEGPPPPWMAKRPAGLRALIHAFDKGHLDLEALQAFDRPVYFALGGRSNPDYYGRMAARLAAIFPDFHARDVRGAPPLRPATPDRARAPRQLTARTLAARRTMTPRHRRGGTESSDTTLPPRHPLRVAGRTPRRRTCRGPRRRTPKPSLRTRNPTRVASESPRGRRVRG
jgi:pimeloyl-ACP methyl ester carboxylesterase